MNLVRIVRTHSVYYMSSVPDSLEPNEALKAPVTWRPPVEFHPPRRYLTFVELDA